MLLTAHQCCSAQLSLRVAKGSYRPTLDMPGPRGHYCAFTDEQGVSQLRDLVRETYIAMF